MGEAHIDELMALIPQVLLAISQLGKGNLILLLVLVGIFADERAWPRQIFGFHDRCDLRIVEQPLFLDDINDVASANQCLPCNVGGFFVAQVRRKGCWKKVAGMRRRRSFISAFTSETQDR